MRADATLCWRQVAEEFEAAAVESSTTAAFFAKHGELVARETEYSKASSTPSGSWVLLDQLRTLVAACELATERAEKTDGVDALVRVFVDEAVTVDECPTGTRRTSRWP